MLFVSQYCYHMIYQRSLFEVFRSNDNFLVRLPDIHLVPSPWVLLHMIHWVLSSVTCKLPLVLAIIFISWHSLVDDHIIFQACLIFTFPWNTSWKYLVHDRWRFLHEIFIRQRLRFYRDFSSFAIFVISSWPFIICQHCHFHHGNISVVNTRWPLTIYDVSTLTCFEHRFVGVEFPESFSSVWLILAVDTSS